MSAGEERTIAYQGVLEQNGAAANGTFTARFGLFTSAAANTACVVTNDCPLWSEEQDIAVANGRFAVSLGAGDGPTALDDDVLAASTLFLAVAVKGPLDAAFTALGGVQEILPVPWASRVGADGVDTAAPRAASVTRDKLAPGTRFSARIQFNPFGASYIATDVNPPNWFASNVVPFLGGGQVTYTAVFPGVSSYTCVATPEAIFFGQSADIVKILVNGTTLTFAQTLRDGSAFEGNFTVLCDPVTP